MNGGLQIECVGDQNVEVTPAQRLHQLLQQKPGASHLVPARLLKAQPQRDGECAADHHHGDDTVIVLNALAELPIDLALDAALQTTGATARIGTADLDAIDGGHNEATRPAGAQHGVALDLSGHPAAEGEDALGVLVLHGVAEGIVAEGANALGQRSPAALGFDLEQGGDLSGGPEKQCGEHLQIS